MDLFSAIRAGKIMLTAIFLVLMLVGSFVAVKKAWLPFYCGIIAAGRKKCRQG